MASWRPIWAEPVRLVVESSSGELEVNPEAIRLLEEPKLARKAVRVCSAVGQMRFGKSYILNRVAGHSGAGGFSLGHTTESTTKGIWIWASEHPHQPNEVLLTLDTEGLFDPKKPQGQQDKNRFVLTILLSTLLIVNVPSVLTSTILGDLEVATTLSKFITEKANGDGPTVSAKMPTLLFLVRDFSLSLGQFKNDPDEYLASVLNDEDESEDFDANKRNFYRTNLKKRYQSYCRTLPTPTSNPEKENVLLGTDREDTVTRPEFKLASEKVVQEVWDQTKVFSVGPANATCASYAAVVTSIVADIQAGVMPSVPNVLDSLRSVLLQQSVAIGVEMFVASLKEKFPGIEVTVNEEHFMAVRSLADPVDETALVLGIGEAQTAGTAEMARQPSTVLSDATHEFHSRVSVLFEQLREKNYQVSAASCRYLVGTLRERLSTSSENLNTPAEFDALVRELQEEYEKQAVGPGRVEGRKFLEEGIRQEEELVKTKWNLTQAQEESRVAQQKAEEESKRALEAQEELQRAAEEAKKQAEAYQEEMQHIKNAMELERERQAKERQEMEARHEASIAKAAQKGEKKLAKALELARENSRRELEEVTRRSEERLAEERQRMEHRLQEMAEKQREAEERAAKAQQQQQHQQRWHIFHWNGRWWLGPTC